MKEDFLMRSTAATKAVRLDRQALNEAVAAGYYPCAPKTTQGSARLFDHDDLLVLWVFARLLEHHLSPSDAGSLACRMREMIKHGPHTDVMVFVKPQVVPGFFKPLVDDATLSTDTRYAGGRRIEYTMNFYLSTAREEIQQAIDAERKIIGQED